MRRLARRLVAARRALAVLLRHHAGMVSRALYLNACVAESVAATRILRPLFVTCQPAGDVLHDRRLGTANPNCPGIKSKIGNGISVLPMYFWSVW